MGAFTEILSVVGFIIRAIGFALLGFTVARFTMESYKKAVWQVQIALALGFFFLLVGLTNYSSPGSMGLFAIGAGAAMFTASSEKKEKVDDKKDGVVS